LRFLSFAAGFGFRSLPRGMLNPLNPHPSCKSVFPEFQIGNGFHV
jgi:hypothetical protein